MKLNLVLILVGALAVCAPGFASSSQILYPGEAGYISTTTLINIPGQYDFPTQIGSGALTVNFNGDMMFTFEAGDGSPIEPWSSPPFSETPLGTATMVADSAVANTMWDITMNLGTPAQTFGFEAEPDGGVANLTANFYDGATLLTNTTWGPQNGVLPDGARLFALSVSPGLTITSVELMSSDTSGNTSMSFGNIREGSTYLPAPALDTAPEPGTSLLLGAGLVSLGLLSRRRFRT
jgi:hypothetical protein